jgi:hypothetical protein
MAKYLLMCRIMMRDLCLTDVKPQRIHNSAHDYFRYDLCQHGFIKAALPVTIKSFRRFAAFGFDMAARVRQNVHELTARFPPVEMRKISASYGGK